MTSDPTRRDTDLVGALNLVTAEGEVLANATEQADDGNIWLSYTADSGGIAVLVAENVDGFGSYQLSYEWLETPQVIGRTLWGGDGGNRVMLDKHPLFDNQAASFSNLSNVEGGITGIAIDVVGAAGTLRLDDFELTVGNDSEPELWGAAPAPSAIQVEPGQGIAGSDRVYLSWNEGEIQNEWLQVLVKANDNTGLPSSDRFYFGHLLGETGDNPNAFEVSITDTSATHQYAGRETATTIGIDRFDFNLDGTVDERDFEIADSALGERLAAIFPDERPVFDPPSRLGDTNLDRRFTTMDLVTAFQAGEFEDAFTGNSTWEEGDWDGDGDFTTRDLVFAFQHGLFEGEPPQAAVPAFALERAFASDAVLAFGDDDDDDGESFNLEVSSLGDDDRLKLLSSFADDDWRREIV